jgi:ubiquinone/menaquinone biosynthesis C-methylase UbiE
MTTTRGRFGSLRTSEIEYAKIAEARIAVVFPKIGQLLRQQKAKTVLDFGGGDGLFLQKCLPRTVKRAIHFDASANMRALAKARLGASARYSVVASTGKLPAQSLDAVTMIAVWMEFPTRKAALANLREIARLLQPQGHLYAAVTHPSFRETTFSGFWTDFSNKRYFDAGGEYKVKVTDGNHKATFQDYHWNIEHMSLQLYETGFAIRRVFELMDWAGARMPGRGSPWLIIDAQKLDD